MQPTAYGTVWKERWYYLYGDQIKRHSISWGGSSPSLALRHQRDRACIRNQTQPHRDAIFHSIKHLPVFLPPYAHGSL